MIGRTVVGGILVLAAAAVAAPALTGFYLAREFDKTLARIERPGLVRVTSARFDRGWFSSNAELGLSLSDDLCAARPCPSLQLTTRIHHGPFAFGAPVDAAAGFRPSLGVAETRIDAGGLWPRLIFQPSLPVAKVVTRVGFDGQAKSRLRIDGASLSVSREQPLAHIDIDASTAHWTQPLGRRRAAGRAHGALSSPGLSVIGEDGGQIVWRGLALNLPAADAPKTTAPSLTLDAINAADGLGTAGRLSALEVRWQPVRRGEAAANPRARLSGTFDIRAAQLAFDNSQVGPLIAKGSTSDLNWRALGSLADRIANLYDANGVIDAGVRDAIYQQELPRLFSGSAELAIQRLHVLTAHGDIDAQLRVTAPEQLRSVRLLADVISQLDVDVALGVPQAMARDIAAQVMLASGRSPYDIEDADIDNALAELVADGLIEARPEDDAYGFALTVEDGRLRLNGRNQIGWQSVVDQFEAARERL